MTLHHEDMQLPAVAIAGWQTVSSPVVGCEHENLAVEGSMLNLPDIHFCSGCEHESGYLLPRWNLVERQKSAQTSTSSLNISQFHAPELRPLEICSVQDGVE